MCTSTRAFYRPKQIALVVTTIAMMSLASSIRAEESSFRNNLVEITASVDKPEVRPGDVVKVTLKLVPALGYHTYPIERESSAENLGLTFVDSDWCHPLWKHQGNNPKPYPVMTDSGPVLAYDQEFTSSIVVWISKDATPAKKKLTLAIEGTVCDRHSCTLLNDARVTIDVSISGSPVEPPTEYREEINSIAPGPKSSGAPPAKQESPEKKKVRALIDTPTAEDYAKSMDEILAALDNSTSDTSNKQAGLSFLVAGVFWGLVSLITPCVFPMIPITVSFFLKQSERSHHKPITMAAVYCATIVVVMTIAAVALLSFFQWLSQNAFTNLAIGALFIVFALSLFGMYELELPSFIAQWTASKESKGGFAGTIFTALTFTILSFACVAPFLGGFGGTAASAQFSFFERMAGGMAFAITFASPFFILALFPSLLRKLPKSGTWLNSVKVVMGFLELAAAFKFLRLGEMLLSSQGTSLFTYDLVLGLWIALAILCALYLLNFYRLPHDTPLESLGVPRVLLAAVFLCLAFYMLPALFKYNSEGEPQRPTGSVYAWIDSFLLPDAGDNSKLVWSGNLKKLIAESRDEGDRTNRPPRIFLDMTAVSCTNCRLNEKDVFGRPEITALMQKYKLVQIYTDVVPAYFYGIDVDLARVRADGRANYHFQDAAFRDVQLPLYAVLSVEPGGKLRVVGTYTRGRITDVGEFAGFLRDNAGTQ